jgi:hypothetical protein
MVDLYPINGRVVYAPGRAKGRRLKRANWLPMAEGVLAPPRTHCCAGQ